MNIMVVWALYTAKLSAMASSVRLLGHISV